MQMILYTIATVWTTVVVIGVIAGVTSTPAEDLTEVPARPVLGAYVQSLMTECGAKLSEVHTAVMIEQVVTVAEQTFDHREHQEAFALLLCVEAKFNPKAKSPVGAIGLAQVMPKYAPEFAAACGLGKMEAADLEYPAVNLRIGACQFKRLLDTHGGSIPMALASYNAGLNSPSVKRLAGLAASNPETDSYIAKFAVIQARMKKDTTD